jgi:hypothetical protein
LSRPCLIFVKRLYNAGGGARNLKIWLRMEAKLS